MRRLLFVAVVTVCTLPLCAQRFGVPPLGRPIPPLAPIPPVGTGLTMLPSGRCCPPSATHRFRFRRSGFPGLFPAFFDGFDSAVTEYVPVPYEARPAPNPVQAGPPPEPSEPLLIEREGDRFVRYGGVRAGSRSPERPSARALGEYRASARDESPAGEVRPVVLVFRDGHRQEVAHYLITNSILYAYTAGQTFPVPLARLDLAATMDANRQRGVSFLMPAATNEVVISF